ncbi:MAG: threonine synthase [Lentisphaerae bacterium]|nr:threonine synthase [Lentisphaerota bacterium]
MSYFSTRGQTSPVSFSDAVMMGLARDGGLLLPSAIPDVRDQLDAWSALPYPALAAAVMQPYVDLPPADLRALVDRSYASFRHPEIAPVVSVGGVHIVELFHGPTLAFKDVALQLLGNMFEYLLAKSGGTLNLLGATSGDTGSAAIHGVRGKDRIRIFILHPKGRVSRSQELQMTSVLDQNVHNLSVGGTFDDCQRIVKELFNDLALRDGCHLGSVNSINWARVLAQVVYYFYAAFVVMRRTGARTVRFAVPTGNFGDIFAGWIALRMGLPISKLVLATNENNILSRFFRTGEYRMGTVHTTLSPSMDIQVASNFERYLYYRVGENAERLRDLMASFARDGALHIEPSRGGVDPLIEAGQGDRAATLETIREFYRESGYLLDPHTAVGVHVGRHHLAGGEPMICLATAHPAKFSAAIREAIGEDVTHHPILDALEGAATRATTLPAETAAVRDYVVGHVG